MEKWLTEHQHLRAPEAPPVAKAARIGAPVALPTTFKVGDRVSGVLVEKSPKGTWKARVEGFLALGPINSKDLPASLKEGDTVQLRVSVSKPTAPAFLWVKE
jgi:hypothetical protein